MAEVEDLLPTDDSNTARFPEGMAAGVVNNNARKLEGLLCRYLFDQQGSVAVTGTDTYAANLNVDNGCALYDGWPFCGDFANACTGPSTNRRSIWKAKAGTHPVPSG